MPMTDQQLNNYEGLLRQQADNAAQQRIGNLGNMNAMYGSPSMTSTVNAFNYDRQNDYINALGEREKLAQMWQQTANQRALTAAQIKNMQNEHSRGLMGIAMQRQQQKQQQLQHEQSLAHQKAMQEGQFEHATNLQQAGFVNDATQETRRQQSAIKLQKQQLEAQKKIEEARQAQSERHFGAQFGLSQQQLAEQVAARREDERFRSRTHAEDLAERQQGRLAQEAQHAANLAEQRRATGVLENFRQTSHDQNLLQQRDLQSQQLNQQHNQFQQSLADKNVDRAFQAQQARAGRAHATEMQRENIAAQDRANYQRRQEVIENLKHQAEVLREHRRGNLATEQLQRDQQQLNLAEQRAARNQNIAWQKEQHADDLADRREGRADEIAARERILGTQLSHASGERRAEAASRLGMQRENIAAQRLENARRMALERQVHGDNIAERRADRRVSQQQFDAQMRQAKLRDIEQKRMNIESMKLARGKISHGEWLDKFNANLAHMGLQLKREKLDQLMNGTLQAPDETASSQQKLSWLSGLLSNMDADEGARLDRAFGRDDSLHDRQLNRVSTMTQLRLGQLSARERLNAQNRETRENIFTQLLAPIATGAAKLFF